MPTYDFLCADCGLVFEGLVWRDERPSCPECASDHTGRQFSPPKARGQGVRGAEPAAVEASARDAAEPAADDAEARGDFARDAEALVQSIRARIGAVAERDERSEPIDLGPPAARPVVRAEPHDPTLRREAPESWDLEREFERREAGHLREISQKSERILQLMARIEELEPLVDEIGRRDGDLEGVEVRCRELEAEQRRTAGELAEVRAALEKQTAGSTVLAERLADSEELVRRREDDLHEQERWAEEQRRKHAEELAERDHRVEGLRTRVSGLETDIDEHRHRADEVAHERDQVRAELESRTAALFKRDELIREADGELEGLRDEVRERERAVADAEQREQRLRLELDQRAGELLRRSDEVRELDAQVVRLSDELLTARADVQRVEAELDRARAENRELEAANGRAGREIELQRAKLESSTNHLQLTQMVLEELRPMLESLESTLTPGSEVEGVLTALDSVRSGDAAAD